MALPSSIVKNRNFLALNILLGGWGVIFIALAALTSKMIVQANALTLARDDYRNILASFIGISAVAIFTSVMFGLLGAVLRNKCHLTMFKCCLFLAFIAQIILCVIMDSYIPEVSDSLRHLMYVSSDYHGRNVTSAFMDTTYEIQRSLKCCGYDGSGSWALLGGLLPETCCPAGDDPAACVPDGLSVYAGCREPFEHNVHGYFIATAVMCAVLCLGEVVGFVYSCILSRNM